MKCLAFDFSGLQTNKSCVFPFKRYGVTYYGCAVRSSLPPWCSTEVDENGVHVGQSSWGECGPDCPTQKEILKKLTWTKDETFKMTLQYSNEALWTGLELYGILSASFLLYGFILTFLILAISKIIFPIPYNCSSLFQF